MYHIYEDFYSLLEIMKMYRMKTFIVYMYLNNVWVVTLSYSCHYHIHLPYMYRNNTLILNVL